MRQPQIVLRHRSCCLEAFAAFHQYTTNACSGSAYKPPFGSRETEGRCHVGSHSELRHTLTTHILNIRNFIGQLECVIIVAGYPFAPSLYVAFNFTHRGSGCWFSLRLLPAEFEFKSLFVDIFSFQKYSENCWVKI